MTDDEKLELASGCEGHIDYANRIIAAHTAKLLAGVEMPEPVGVGPVVRWESGDTPSLYRTGLASVIGCDVFTKDQLQQYAAAAAAQAREKALADVERAAYEPPINGNSIAQARILMAIDRLKGGE